MMIDLCGSPVYHGVVGYRQCVRRVVGSGGSLLTTLIAVTCMAFVKNYKGLLM